MIAKASLLHLQENYKSAIEYYEQAFTMHDPDALTAYKVAGMYSLDSNADKAFHYLQINQSDLNHMNRAAQTKFRPQHQFYHTL